MILVFKEIGLTSGQAVEFVDPFSKVLFCSDFLSLCEASSQSSTPIFLHCQKPEHMIPVPLSTAQTHFREASAFTNQVTLTEMTLAKSSSFPLMPLTKGLNADPDSLTGSDWSQAQCRSWGATGAQQSKVLPTVVYLLVGRWTLTHGHRNHCRAVAGADSRLSVVGGGQLAGCSKEQARRGSGSFQGQRASPGLQCLSCTVLRRWYQDRPRSCPALSSRHSGCVQVE